MNKVDLLKHPAGMRLQEHPVGMRLQEHPVGMRLQERKIWAPPPKKARAKVPNVKDEKTSQLATSEQADRSDIPPKYDVKKKDFRNGDRPERTSPSHSNHASHLRATSAPFYRKPPPQRWTDEDGRKLTAGGILPCDANGLWAVLERTYSDSSVTASHNDIGGRYNFEDGDIYQTIAREFTEETYASSELTRSTVLKLWKLGYPVYLNGPSGNPVYVCLIIDVKFLFDFGVTLNPELFQHRRQEVIFQNQDTPSNHFKVEKLSYIPFAQLKTLTFPRDESTIGSRLREILSSKPLWNMINEPRVPHAYPNYMVGGVQVQAVPRYAYPGGYYYPPYYGSQSHVPQPATSSSQTTDKEP